MGIILDNSTHITSPLTVFGELLVGQLTPDIQLIYSHGLNTELVTPTVTGTGTVTVANSELRTAVGATAGTAKCVSKKTAIYVAGVGVQAMFSVFFQTGSGNTKQHRGLSNGQDALLVAYQNNVLGVIHRKNNVDTFIPQSSFSEDTIDSFGPSGFNIIPSNGNLFKIEFQYLGVGDILFYVKAEAENSFILFHRISWTNQNTSLSVLAPYYKAWDYVENTGNPTQAVVMRGGSFSVSHQGNMRAKTRTTPVRNQKINVTTETNIFTIKSRTTINGVTNFIPCDIVFASFGVSSANTVTTIRIVRNATVNGTPVFTNISTTTSVLQKDTAGTTVVAATGVELMSFSLPINGDKDLDLSPFILTMEPGDTITVAASGTNSGSFNCALLLKENW